MKNRVAKLREDKGLSQKTLADMIGISQQTLSSWEVGRTTPKPHHMQFLEEFFDVKKEVIFFEDFNYKK